MVKGICPLFLLNMYWIQLVALQSPLPHIKLKALTLPDGASTSWQALNIAKQEQMQFHYFVFLTPQSSRNFEKNRKKRFSASKKDPDAT